jgi:hypothetical protein
VIVESMGGPDPLRSRYREHPGEAIRRIVFFGSTLGRAIEAADVPAVDIAAFGDILRSELERLEPYNCARFRLPIGKTQEWID